MASLFQFHVFVLILVVSSSALVFGLNENSDTLRLSQVLFRHGDRTNDAGSTYPNDPYINETYYPYGIGQLTNRGKQREYMLGKTLRKRYDNFLGSLYTPDVLDAVSTDVNRTKMSLQLVLTGLYPPAGTDLEWNRGLNWQPIPYNYIPFNQDWLLTFSLFYCPNYALHYHAYITSPEGLKIQQKYTELYQYLTEHTGKNITSTLDVYFLFLGLTAEEEWGLQLPSWTINVFPKYMERAVIDHYVTSSATTELKQLSGGFLLKQMIRNMQSKRDKTLTPQGRKIFLYSGHELNVGYLLNALEVYFPHVPPYGSFVLVELHEINRVYGVKIFYQDYSDFEPKPLKVPGCQLFCPLNKFAQLLQKNLPADGDSCGDDVSATRRYERSRRNFEGRF